MTAPADEVGPGDGERIEVDGVGVNLIRCGAGAALVLVHGAGPGIGAAYSFARVLPRLSRSFDVIAADLPGYGRSDPLPGADTPVDVAEHLARLLDQLGTGPAVVLGHSRGGRIAVELCARRPDLVRALFVMSSGSTAPGSHRDESGAFTSAATAIVGFGADGETGFEAFAHTRRISVHDPAALDDARLRCYYDEWCATGRREHYVRQMALNDPLNYYHVADADRFREQLAAVACPVAVLWGREDVVAPVARSYQLVDLFRDVEFHVVSGVGHSPNLERPELLCELVERFAARHGCALS
jgi:pimeloyl-ACP methyl ester carboxylesterase